ncbi:MAG: ABC transporter ATP-binding protein [Chitinophagia bacterium]|nr:ABC transporter ATP-binding protein [Chitinophagia bacterium]
MLRRLFGYTKPYKGTLYLSITLSILLALLSPVRPYLIQLCIDKYIPEGNREAVLWLVGLQFGLLLLDTALRFTFLYRTNQLGQTVVHDLRKDIYQKLLYQNTSFFDKNAIGTLTTRNINDIEAINDVFSEGVISISADVLTIIAIITVMLLTSWKITLVCLVIFPLLIGATWWFKENVNKSFQRVRDAVAALNAFVQEHIAGMYIVQAYAAEQRELARFQGINKEHRDANIKGIFAYSVFFPVVEIILAVSMGLLVWYGSVQMVGGHASAGIIVAFVMYLNQLFRPLRMLADKFNVLQMGIIAGERVFAILDSEEHLKSNGTYCPAVVRGDITFKDVHFAYKPDAPVLQGVSFNLPAGTTMAIIGPTGAGKSSIISLINRQYELQGGQILIDGIPLQDYDIYALRRHIGIVLQDVFLFSGTITDNITLRNKDIPTEKVIDVCQMLGIHNFIMQLPDNYNYVVPERGNTLSQGQRQLLSFARVLLYDPAILILDEATSSIDSESEQLVQKAINKLVSGRTAIVIAHRLSTIRHARHIVVLENGKISEQGTHDSLMATGGKYSKMTMANG